MATRFYFGQLITSPALAFSAAWSAAGSTPQRALLRTVKRQAVLSTAPFVNTSSETTAAILNKLNAQFIMRLGAAQTITGTVKGYALFSESDLAQDCRVQCEIRVISESGTVRGTLLAADAGALSSEFVAAATNRRIPLLAATNTLTSVSAQAGDYLVVEIGHRTHVASGTSYNVTLRWHDDPATGDLPEDETSTDTTLAPWIEFSQTLILSETYDDLDNDPLGAVSALPAPADIGEPAGPSVEFPDLAQTLLGYGIAQRLANQSTDNLTPTFFLFPTAGDLSAAAFTDNPTPPSSFAAPSGMQVAAAIGATVYDPEPAAFNTLVAPLLNYNLVDPTNCDQVTSSGGGGGIRYTNRVYDSIAIGFIKWTSVEPDTAGTAYPGPGVFSVTTTDYVIERRSVV